MVDEERMLPKPEEEDVMLPGGKVKAARRQGTEGWRRLQTGDEINPTYRATWYQLANQMKNRDVVIDEIQLCRAYKERGRYKLNGDVMGSWEMTWRKLN